MARVAGAAADFLLQGWGPDQTDWYTWTSLWAIDDAEVDRSARAHHGFGNLRPKHSTNVDVVVVVHHERGTVGHHEERKKFVGNNELVVGETRECYENMFIDHN